MIKTYDTQEGGIRNFLNKISYIFFSIILDKRIMSADMGKMTLFYFIINVWIYFSQSE